MNAIGAGRTRCSSQFNGSLPMNARRHHFVSQCYLKSFAVPRKGQSQTTVFDGFDRKSYRTGISNVGAERDFNRFEAEGLDPNALEVALAKFEAELAPALERIIAARSISDDNDRACLLNFMCLLALRNPRLRETMRQAQDRTARIVMDMVLSSKDRYESQLRRARDDGFATETEQISYEDMKKYVEEGKFKIDVATERHIQLELDIFPKILPLFFKRGWLLLKAPPKSGGFITSDHPTCLMWSDPAQRSGFYGPGLGIPGTDLFFRYRRDWQSSAPSNSKTESVAAPSGTCAAITPVGGDAALGNVVHRLGADLDLHPLLFRPITVVWTMR